MGRKVSVDKVKKALKQTLKDQDMTQRDFSRVAGIGESEVSNLLSGKSLPSVKLLDALGFKKVITVTYETKL